MVGHFTVAVFAIVFVLALVIAALALGQWIIAKQPKGSDARKFMIAVAIALFLLAALIAVTTIKTTL